MIGVGTGQENVALRYQRADQVGARLDTIRNHGVLDTTKLIHALDFDPARSVALDLRAHPFEEIGEGRALPARRRRFR